MMNFAYPKWMQPQTGQPTPLTMPGMQYLLNQGGQRRPPASAQTQGFGSYLPSIQTFNNVNPSNQDYYQSYVADNVSGLGMNPNDVGWLMKRLAPHAYQRGPKWASMGNP